MKNHTRHCYRLRPGRTTMLRTWYRMRRRYRNLLHRRDPALRLAVAVTALGLIILMIPILWERHDLTTAAHTPAPTSR